MARLNGVLPPDVYLGVEEVIPVAFSPGYEPRKLTVNEPGDQLVYLSRTPENAWILANGHSPLPDLWEQDLPGS